MKKFTSIILASIVLTGCIHRPKTTSSPAVSLTPFSQTQEENSLTPDTTIELSMDNFSYSQKEILVNKGDLVTIKVTNTQGTHDFVIDELGLNSGIVPTGESKTFEFRADREGIYEYYCSVGNHRQMGMRGKLIVQMFQE